MKKLICKIFGHKMHEWRTVRIEGNRYMPNPVKHFCSRCGFGI